MIRVCGYVRASTEEQHQSGLGLLAQRDAIRAACEARGFELTEIFEDVASGRSIQNRPGLRAALAAVDSGRCEGLVASKLDRLGRSVADVATTIEHFTTHRKTLVLLDVGIDTSTIMGAAMAQMASVFAELERKRISQRTSEALRALPPPPQERAARLPRGRTRRGEAAAVRGLDSPRDRFDVVRIGRRHAARWLSDPRVGRGAPHC